MIQRKSITFSLFFACVVTNVGMLSVDAEQPDQGLHAVEGIQDVPDFSVIPESQWQSVERSVDRAIEFLMSQQHRDGSFGLADVERPAVTALCCMAMLSRGHILDTSSSATKESRAIVRGVDYVLSRQRDDGLLGHSIEATTHGQYLKYMSYNHAICGMFLTEVYGMTDPERAKRIEIAVDAALKLTRQTQLRKIPMEFEVRDRGGWRYLNDFHHMQLYSDLSVSSWFVMFLRSAENAGFDVPVQWAKESIDYVIRCYDKKLGVFCYGPGRTGHTTRGLCGAGIVCLFLTGHKEPEMEKRSGKWILDHPYDRYNHKINPNEHFHYGLYYQSQAAMQIGGRVWEQFYPQMAKTLITHQAADGGWQREGKRPEIGRVYPSAMTILALTTPYQLLPIYQR
jgi:hypothetical protein